MLSHGIVSEYRYLAHAGELFGYDGLMTMHPDMNTGVYTCFNGPGGESAFICNQLLHYCISDLLLGYDPWLSVDTICTFPEPWKPTNSYYPYRIHTELEKGIPPTRKYDAYVGTYRHDFLGDINVVIKDGMLCMEYGRIGQFELYPNGIDDEFRLIGCGSLSFLHQVDLYVPSDWMMVNFQMTEELGTALAYGICCSLFESGPIFMRLSG